MGTLGLLSETGRYGLATDLYQLTMAAAYFESGLAQEPAVFELFVRQLPPDRGYLLAAGLEQAVEYLRGLRFDGPSIEHLRTLPVFAGVAAPFWEYLRELRFQGDLEALREGTAVFADEPLLQVRAPLLQAQLVETFLLSVINHQTAIATKAARVVDAAGGRGVVEFGARRAHGFDAALFGARAAFIGGCVGTSNVLAGQVFGIDVYGTAAHSFTMAFEDEAEAFRAFHRVFPQHAILLVDTCDTLEGTRRAAAIPGLRGVRLDSGDVAALSVQVRRILDEAGHAGAVIVASGDLDEHRIAALTAQGAPVDLYGVGTELITSRDAPALGGVYKLVAVERGGRRAAVRKLSPGKATYPEWKQVFRKRDAAGGFVGDTLGLRGESVEGEPLLAPVVRAGAPCAGLPPLSALRERARRQREALPPGVRGLRDPEAYPVRLSPGLQEVIDSLSAARPSGSPASSAAPARKAALADGP